MPDQTTDSENRKGGANAVGKVAKPVKQRTGDKFFPEGEFSTADNNNAQHAAERRAKGEDSFFDR